ncbi:hypothetical protein JOL79_07285 [Microbispora sp. RL4-1S]|uniref:Uncharacterized protein n=1 Tax=Microbispora oryzae TaxID=2806554 RepID=A0A941AI98_9ACTN|nr:hypothetical protein [Microbispora oryzae]MBP2703602.1 hypothetical protein [Microbispora oryzae]
MNAAQLMTGLHSPLARGSFDLAAVNGLGDGGCAVYEREGGHRKFLQIELTPGGSVGEIQERLAQGASSLPEIVPGAIGYYFKDRYSKSNSAYAMLVQGRAELNIQLEIGVAGRDNAADVVALMRLIAPKLITDASAVSPGPSGAGRSSGGKRG